MNLPSNVFPMACHVDLRCSIKLLHSSATTFFDAKGRRRIDTHKSISFVWIFIETSLMILTVIESINKVRLHETKIENVNY